MEDLAKLAMDLAKVLAAFFDDLCEKIEDLKNFSFKSLRLILKEIVTVFWKMAEKGPKIVTKKRLIHSMSFKRIQIGVSLELMFVVKLLVSDI